MRKRLVVENISITEALGRMYHLSSIIEPFILLNSNNSQNENVSKLYNSKYDFIAAFGMQSAVYCPQDGSFDALKDKITKENDWLFGHFCYELYTETEGIASPHIGIVDFPLLYFFRPIYVVTFSNQQLCIDYLAERADDTVLQLLTNAHHSSNNLSTLPEALKLKCNISKQAYLDAVASIKQQISKGNLYETNYCIGFFNESAQINPLNVYKRLNEYSPSPFSAYYRLRKNYLLCSSPERYLAKRGNRLVTQPIKGTLSSAIDKDHLRIDPKEKSENIMITDLVRNDLSKVAAKGTVVVDEQCGIYTFSKVHQMISTVSCEIDNSIHVVDAIKNTFPMGSMTGAPKIKAIQISNEHEPLARGIYSGAVGYFSPDNDFDFNVVIRSIVYNDAKKYVSFHVGSAITSMCDAEKEYEECLLKAGAMLNALNASI